MCTIDRSRVDDAGEIHPPSSLLAEQFVWQGTKLS
jgi:hypothetical protein